MGCVQILRSLLNGNIFCMSLTIAYVKGTAPGKWLTRFAERTGHGALHSFESRDPFPLLADAQTDRTRPDLALVRLPDRRVDERFHVVRLYEEQPGVAVPKDSELTLLEELSAADLEDQHINYAPDEYNEVDVSAVFDALDVVAANVGIAFAPRPLLRSINNKSTAHRDYADGQPTSIALVWLKDKDSDAIQDFVGIAKGRTANTSRQAVPKRTAKEKAAAKKEARANNQRKVGRPARRRGRR
jgi:hypothetical protein